ncbi:MAG TPA: metallophosphoesterase [Terriglobales bacterium]|nr:metallophosphoesterase [Terriglobales bacterium]
MSASTIPLRRRYLRHVHSIIHPPRRAVRDPQFTHHVLHLSRWPRGLSGLRIAQLSDIHYSLYMPGGLAERAVDMINRWQPHLIALTGDFVTSSRQFIEPVSELLGRLRAPLGVYAVLGNHDFRVGAERVARGLRRQRIHVLRNSHRVLRLPGGHVKIAGIDDSRQRPNLAAALGPSQEQPFTLLLAHSPAALEDAAAAKVDLVLSGHTHGGQIHLRFAGALYDRYWPVGFLQRGETRMYISRGLGKVILPWRLHCPPEVTVFTLHRRA